LPNFGESQTSLSLNTPFLDGHLEDKVPDDGKDKAAQELGRKGGKARAENMTPERRTEIAKKAALARWKK